MTQVDVYWSVQSPYCYFVLDRMLAFDATRGRSINLKPVRPGVLRLPDSFRERSDLELAYFDVDTARTAAFLGLPMAEPSPSPVTFLPNAWVAAPDQSRIDRVQAMLMASVRLGRGLEFVDRLTRLIWDGSTDHWDQGDHLDQALAAAGLHPPEVSDLIKRDGAALADQVRQNEADMYAAGHWGVPLFTYRGEAFYGQDRWDQLLWRIGENE